MEPVLYEADSPGGLLNNANLIENYPGFPKGVSGVKMAGLLYQQLKSFGITIRFERVSTLDYNEAEFRIVTEKSEHTYHRVILASGTVPNEFNLGGLQELAGRQVFYEVKNLREIEGKRIAVVGGGDAAFDYALSLADANTVTIYNHSDRTSCLPLLYEKAVQKPAVFYKPNHSLTGIRSMGSELRLSWQCPDGEIQEEQDYLLIAIGRSPNLGFISERMRYRLDDLEAKRRIFVIGDVKNGLYRQMGIAVGDGIRAAMILAEELKRATH